LRDEERDRQDNARDQADKLRDEERDRQDKERDQADRAGFTKENSSAASMSTFLLAVSDDNATAGDGKSWITDLTLDQGVTLLSQLDHLHKKSKKEQEIGSQDGQKAIDFFRKEYEEKEAHVIAKYKKIAAKQAGASDTNGTFLIATGDSDSKGVTQLTVQHAPDGAKEPHSFLAQGHHVEHAHGTSATSLKIATGDSDSKGVTYQTAQRDLNVAQTSVAFSAPSSLAEHFPVMPQVALFVVVSMGMLVYIVHLVLSRRSAKPQVASLSDPLV